MPEHNFSGIRGRVEEIVVDSPALRGNLVGDPSKRRVAVYLPPGHDASPNPYPLFVGLAGFTGSGLKHLSWQGFGESLPQRMERLVDRGQMGPVILALPDCFTSLGGNQYVDSVALGAWERFLLDDMLPAVEREFRVDPEPARRAVFGKSSGGYGALVQGLRHGGHWGAVASHSADVGFEWVYLRDMPMTLDALAGHGGNVTTFIEKLRGARKVEWSEMHVLMVLAMAASYDPDPDAPFGIRLPVDPETCELDPERWGRWLEHDPVRLADRADCLENLRKLRGLFIDCGSKDQFFLHYGSRALRRKLQVAGIEHRYEEFDDNHSSVDYRMDVSLPWLYRALR